MKVLSNDELGRQVKEKLLNLKKRDQETLINDGTGFRYVSKDFLFFGKLYREDFIERLDWKENNRVISRVYLKEWVKKLSDYLQS